MPAGAADLAADNPALASPDNIGRMTNGSMTRKSSFRLTYQTRSCPRVLGFTNLQIDWPWKHSPVRSVKI